MGKANTSWGNVAKWYDTLLEGSEGTFQNDVILPNLLRLLDVKPGQKLIDVACGQGFFARHFADQGADVTGVDVSTELIALATAHEKKQKRKQGSLKFVVAPAHDMTTIKTASADVATIILAIQNIAEVHATLNECARILTRAGRLVIVMNHPAFRVPKASSWGWDEVAGIEYRRIEAYLSEAKIKIDMHPGEKNRTHTITFHRPLQFYVKALGKAGFGVTHLEEWISNRPGPKGRKFAATEKARKEIPLFLCIEAKKI